MGLDMYLEGRKYLWGDWQNEANTPKEDGFRLKGKVLELGYWRKHPDLHGYIVETFADGKDECQEIWLSKEDLYNIIVAIKDKRLPHTEGFFFGESYSALNPQEEVDAESIKILEAAIKWLDEKEDRVSRDVYYQASW